MKDPTDPLLRNINGDILRKAHFSNEVYNCVHIWWEKGETMFGGSLAAGRTQEQNIRRRLSLIEGRLRFAISKLIRPKQLVCVSEHQTRLRDNCGTMELDNAPPGGFPRFRTLGHSLFGDGWFSGEWVGGSS